MSPQPLPLLPIMGEGVIRTDNMRDRVYKKPYKPRYTINTARKLRKNITESEDNLWKYLRNRNFMGLKFRRQVPFGRYIIDFYCKEKNLAIEIDGNYHKKIKKYDKNREGILKSTKMKILRFSNTDVQNNINVTLKAIEESVI